MKNILFIFVFFILGLQQLTASVSDISFSVGSEFGNSDYNTNIMMGYKINKLLDLQILYGNNNQETYFEGLYRLSNSQIGVYILAGINVNNIKDLKFAGGYAIKVYRKTFIEFSLNYYKKYIKGIDNLSSNIDVFYDYSITGGLTLRRYM